MRTLPLSNDKTISINDLRRKFGDIEKSLPFLDRIVVTKKGKPFAILSATPAAKRDLMKETAGVFKGTELEKDDIWKEVLKKKSHKANITL